MKKIVVLGVVIGAVVSSIALGSEDEIPFRMQNYGGMIEDIQERYHIKVWIGNGYKIPELEFLCLTTQCMFVSSFEQQKVFIRNLHDVLSLFPPFVIHPNHVQGLQGVFLTNADGHLKSRDRYVPAFADIWNGIMVFDSSKSPFSTSHHTILHELFHIFEGAQIKDSQYRALFEGCPEYEREEHPCGQQRAEAFANLFVYKNDTGRFRIAVDHLKDYTARKRIELLTGCHFDLETGRFTKVYSLDEYRQEFGYDYYRFFPLWSLLAANKIVMDEQYWNAFIDGKRVSWTRDDAEWKLVFQE